MTLAEMLIIGGLSLFGGVFGYGLWWILQRRASKSALSAPSDSEHASQPEIPPGLSEPPAEQVSPSPEQANETVVLEGSIVSETEFEEADAEEDETQTAIPQEEGRPPPVTKTLEDNLIARLASIETTLRDMAGAQATLLEQVPTAPVDARDNSELKAELEAQTQKIEGLETAIATLTETTARSEPVEQGADIDTLSAILAAIEGLPAHFDVPISEKVLPHLALLSQDLASMGDRWTKIPDHTQTLSTLSDQVAEVLSMRESFSATNLEEETTVPKVDEMDITRDDGVSLDLPDDQTEAATKPEATDDEIDDVIPKSSIEIDIEVEDTEPSKKSGISYIPADAPDMPQAAIEETQSPTG